MNGRGVSTWYTILTSRALTTTMKNFYFLCQKPLYKLKHIRTMSAQNVPISDSKTWKYFDDAILDKSVILTHHLFNLLWKRTKVLEKKTHNSSKKKEQSTQFQIQKVEIQTQLHCGWRCNTGLKCRFQWFLALSFQSENSTRKRW